MASDISGTSDIGLSLSTERKVMHPAMSGEDRAPLVMSLLPHAKPTGLFCLRTRRGQYDDEWAMVQFRRGTTATRELVSAVSQGAFTRHQRWLQPHMPRLWFLWFDHAR